MRRPYVEPGLRSARPGIRHRSRSNGPDRKGRDPTSLPSTLAADPRPVPTRHVSETSQLTETEDEAFYSGDDTGALTQPEDRDNDDDDQETGPDEDEDEDEDEAISDDDDDDDAERVPAAARQRSVASDSDRDSESAGTLEQTTRPAPALAAAKTGYGSSATLTRPRAYSGPRKLAPEEELALRAEKKRRKGGVFGRLKRLARGKKSDDKAGELAQAYDADAIIGRSHSAVTELRSRRSFVSQRNRSDSQPRSLPRGSYGRTAAAAVIASGTAGVGGAAAYKVVVRDNGSSRGEETFSESGTEVRRAPIASDEVDLDDLDEEDEEDSVVSRVKEEEEDADLLSDESGRASPLTPIEISDQAPRVGTPIALRDAENVRSPELVDPYRTGSSPTVRRTKSLAESVQPSVVDTDAASMIPPSSPLLPISGPLSHQDAIVPSGRPSMQSARDQEIDAENVGRPRTSSSSSNNGVGLKSVAEGALGGLAAMIGLDALREDNTGHMQDASVESKSATPVVSRDLAKSSDPVAELETAEHPMQIKAQESTRSKKVPRAGAVAVPAVVATTAVPSTEAARAASLDVAAPSELPYTIGGGSPVGTSVALPGTVLLADPAPVRRDEGVPDQVDDGQGSENRKKKKKKSKKSKAAAAVAVPAAIGVGIGGLAALADSDDEAQERSAPSRSLLNTPATGNGGSISKKKKKATRAAVVEEVPVVTAVAATEDLPVVTAVGGAGDDAVVLSNLPASNAAAVPSAPSIVSVPRETAEEERRRRKKEKKREARRAERAALVAGAAVPAVVAAPAIATLVAADEDEFVSQDEEDESLEPPPFEADRGVGSAYPAEKASYSSLGMTDAVVPAAVAVPLAAVAVAPAAKVRKPSRRAAKGSRPVDKMPVVADEDEPSSRYGLAPPPALEAMPRRKNFLLTPSIAPSVADPLDSGMHARSLRSFVQRGDWLVKSLSPQQTHYFLRELALRELSWELDRAWLLTNFDRPTKETRRARRRRTATDYEDDSRINDFDDSSDEDLLAPETDEDEEAVFRKLPEEHALPVPDLPLLRFLFKNAFSTFPLFVEPEDKVRARATPPPDKATIARSYFVTAILPLLRAVQSRSLSHSVDRHGEGDGTPFSAITTTGAIRGILLKWASKYITAVLRVGPGDPYFGEEEPLEKDSWPWPAPNLLPPEAYFAYRKPLDRLKYGGFEVDVVGVRKTSATDRDYILRVRRPNRLDEYVVRNDADFEDFRLNLSEELGRYALIRDLPRTGGRPDEGSDDDDESPYSSMRSSNLNQAGIGIGIGADRRAGGSQIRRKPSRTERSLADRLMSGNRDRERGRRYSSGLQDGRPVLGRRVPEDDDDDVFESEDDALVRNGSRRQPLPRDFRGGRSYGRDSVYGDNDDGSIAEGRRYERRRPDARPAYSDDEDFDDDVTEDGRGSGGRNDPKGSKSKRSKLPFGLGSLSRGTAKGGREEPARAPRDRGDALDSRRRGIGRNLPEANDSRGSVAFREEALAPPRRAAAPAAPAPMDYEARRNKLRNWLRDTLAVREAGHAVETQDFTSIGAFPEKALRRADLLDMDDRIREDKHRRREHERDADEAGDDVHDLRMVRNELWRDCVEGDGFLKVYDVLIETPDYRRLPLQYQQMVSWGNLQLARFLYGVFVTGDESRANLARLQDVYESVPWKKLALAMKAPVSQMIRSWQDHLLRKGFLQAVLHVMLEDEPETIDEDLAELRRAIGSDVMFRKLRMFVEAPDDLKRLIRQHAQKAEIPLVAAIVRGSEEPKLNKADVQRVMDATEAYQSFIKTQPTVIKKNVHKEPGYLLICDLQRALRLFSLQRDGAQVRGMLQDPAIADALGSLFEPLLEELRRIHRVKGISGSLTSLQRFLGKLLDHLSGLRARVQDPARSIHSLAELLDSAAPAWYSFLYRLSDVSPTVFSTFAWLRHLAMTVGAGSSDLAEIWTDPPPALVAESEAGGSGSTVGRTGARRGAPTERELDGALDAQTMRDINSLAEYGRRKRNRQMEIACRWAAGDTEEHHNVQVQGDGTGKTRSEPLLPREPRPARAAPGLDRFRKSFREAVAVALAR